ncbi:hypothetical protein [Arthrobacter sp. TMS1-12-1]
MGAGIRVRVPALTHGWLTGEIIRRVTGRMPGAHLEDALSSPLGAEVRLGVPAGRQSGVAHLEASDTLRDMVRAPRAADGPGGTDLPTLAVTLGDAFPQEVTGPDDGSDRCRSRSLIWA